MRGEALVGYAPRAVHWSPDSKRVYFEWKHADEARIKEYTHYVVDADGSNLRALTAEEVKLAPPGGGSVSPDKHMTVFAEEGDIFLYDHAANRKLQVTSTIEYESDPRFTTDGKRITFERQGNLFELSLQSGMLRQLTDIHPSGMGTPAPSDAVSLNRGGRLGRDVGSSRANTSGRTGATTGSEPGSAAETSQDALKKVEKELFEKVRERIEQRDEQEAKRKQQEQGRRKPYSPPVGEDAFGPQLSGDGAYVALTLFKSGDSKRYVIANYVTESGYAEDIQGRGKAGETQARSHMVVLNVETGEAKTVEFTPPPIKAIGVKEGPRQLDWLNWQWSEDGKRAVVMARAADNKDLWLLRVDPATGKTTVLVQTHDDAWVGGPGEFTLGFLPDNRRVYFVSERDGYAHLYTVSTDGGELTQLTRGNFEVSEVRLSEDKKQFYFVSSEEGPADRCLYSTPIDGGPRIRITRLSGADRGGYHVSPDGRTLAFIRSESNRPPELFVMPNRTSSPTDQAAVQITHSPTQEWLSYPWLAPPIISIPTRDGATLYSRLYKPAQWRRGGPAVLFVHGAGYLQNAHNWWSSYYREYMFHHLLMEQGYLVLDADYRGSAGYGRDWRTGIYRHMGGKDLDDEVDAAHWLVKTYGVNPKRIGIYGGSYGGFLTLMAMFTTPDVFAAGAALRPVTVWANYNHGYTANILNEPQNDSEAYRNSSPIFFAEGLKGALLICHGMVDDNVNFQDSVMLAQRLIELRKENWELAGFPVESHTFTQPSSWVDEYKRILKLFDTNLK